MTREEYRAAQISNLPQRPSESAGGAGSSSADDDTPLAAGKGPGGEPLYRAEWYRRPRQAELETYLPRRWAREGSGLIACRTAARYRVEDCKILGETPAGSGYGYAVLQAAFQFLVRPPRIGGKEMVGAWVSIRIDYTVTVK
jgi:protein TonB